MDSSCSTLNEAYYRHDYESDFEQDSVNGDERHRRNDLAKKELTKYILKPQKQEFAEECSKELGRIRRIHDLSLDAGAYINICTTFVLHILCTTALDVVHDLSSHIPNSMNSLPNCFTSKDRTDNDVIRENHRFLWDESETTDTWEKRLAKKYYDKLFKEYCITDLSHFKENKIAMRWRTEKEVIDGKGHFFCGSMHCNEKEELKSWEVNFGYVEQGKKKNALVKLRLCPECSNRLNFHQKHREKVLEGRNQHCEEPRKKSRNSSVSSSVSKEYVHQELTNLGNSETNVELLSASNFWKNPKRDHDTAKDDEFEDYLADMLL